MKNDRMPVTLVGPGAIGTLFAAHLGAAGHSVSVLDRRSERAAELLRVGLSVEREGRESARASLADASTNPADLPPAGLILIALKSYQTEDALDAVRALHEASPGAIVLSLQNGVGNLELLSRAVPPELLAACSTTHGSLALGAGRVRHTGIGQVVVGSFAGASISELESAADAFTDAGLPAAVTGDLEGMLWDKLIINAAINPAAAILKSRNGFLIESEDAKSLMSKLAREAEAVARAANIGVSYPDAAARVEEVARATAANICSMCRDVMEGRPTEIDFITGAVVRRGGEVGVPAPASETVMRIVKAMRPGELAPKG